MKIYGKDNKGRRLIALTEFEWGILTTALHEYKDVSEWGKSNPREIAKLTTVENRIRKSEREFDSLPIVEDKKKLN